MISIKYGDVYISQGASVPILDKYTTWDFQAKKISIGDVLTRGDSYAMAFENIWSMGVTRCVGEP